jgi:hypothetical protein
MSDEEEDIMSQQIRLHIEEEARESKARANGTYYSNTSGGSGCLIVMAGFISALALGGVAVASTLLSDKKLDQGVTSIVIKAEVNGQLDVSKLNREDCTKLLSFIQSRKNELSFQTNVPAHELKVLADASKALQNRYLELGGVPAVSFGVSR